MPPTQMKRPGYSASIPAIASAATRQTRCPPSVIVPCIQPARTRLAALVSTWLVGVFLNMARSSFPTINVTVVAARPAALARSVVLVLDHVRMVSEHVRGAHGFPVPHPLDAVINLGN